MAFADIDAVKIHLVENLGYMPDDVISWLSQFADPRHISALLADPIVVIRDFPITHEEVRIRQKRLTDEALEQADEVWDD